MTRPRLLLIDGHALAYRQYHALPMEHFTTSRGEPTNATYGFARTIVDIFESVAPPKYLAVAFDQGMSGRETLYTAYKGTREKMQDGMMIQMERIRQLVNTFNIPILEKEGYEADDVIGTAARQATAQETDAHVLTGDYDLVQLVDEHTRVEVQVTGKTVVFDIPAVIERYGVRPDQIPDWKGLVGDTSDNIPGVRGIGDKTASELLQKYGSVEGIYQHLDEQKGNRLKSLEVGRENAFMSKRLATIMTDVPLVLDLDACVTHDFDRNAVAELFREVEFRSLLRRFETIFMSAPAAKASSGGSRKQNGSQLAMFDMTVINADNAPREPIAEVVNTVIVDNEQALADLVKALEAAPNIAFDTETTSVDQMKAALVGMSLAVNESEGYYIPLGHAAGHQLPIEQVMNALRPALTDPNKPKWVHNATYDLIIMRRYGIDVAPIKFDVMVGEWLINPETRRKGLKDQAEDRLNIRMTHIEELIGKGKSQTTMDRVAIDRAAPYAAADAAVTYKLVNVLRPDLEKHHVDKLFDDIEMPLIPVIADLDMAGAKLDLPYLSELRTEFAARLDEISAEIHELAGEKFNIGSPMQLNQVLFGKLGLESIAKKLKLRKTTHGYSVDADALESLLPHHKIIERIMAWRSLEKLKVTYVDALSTMVDEEGRIHTTYNQTGSVTGRMSSEAPNLQNIPIRTEEGRRVRKAFIAPPGYRLLSVDYSQIELRILAHYSQDEFLVNAFRQNQDIHQATAAAVFNIPLEEVSKDQRYLAKRVNFGLLYGMGAHRLAQESDLSRTEAKAFIDAYFERLPGVLKYLDGSKESAREHGYLETLLGRRREFRILHRDNEVTGNRGDYARAEREAINMPVQGSAADIIKIAMIRLDHRLKSENCPARLILQVHDELVLEVDEKEVPRIAALVCEVMENAYPLDVPLRADAKVGVNWAEMEPVH